MKSLCIALAILGIPAICAAQQPLSYNRDVRPILSDRCFHCHGPNEEDRQANLRLDQANGPEGAYRALDGPPAIKPGSLANSALWHRINADDDEVMPPPDSAKPPLSADEIDVIKRWIEQGAEYQGYWAFEPPRMPAIPEVENRAWSDHPIDRFVLSQLEAEGIAPNERADRRTLIRRLSLDLTGLPPTRSEIHEFLADTSAEAYEHLVDRLLASPHYGEHMTKYWLDLVRFADTNGIHHDHYREMTPYRDWVIQAFNQNLPYDEFVRYQIAGDLFEVPSRDQLIASGFNRLHLIIDRGTALPEESFNRNVVDRVTAVGTAFMGLTVQCAVCHDHKYDPITMRDFYQLYAFFNNIDADPETGGRQGTDFERGLQPPYISLATEEQAVQLAELERRVADEKARVAQLEQQAEQQADAAAKTANKAAAAEDGAAAEADQNDAPADAAKPEHEPKPEDAAKKARDEAIAQAKAALKKAQDARNAFEATIPVAMVMKERAEPRPAHILIRGAYDNPGEQVQRDTPGFLPPLDAAGDVKTRMDLANWLVSDRFPLTARVAVNRFWQQLFGVGIVKTSEDFGVQGQWPSHPDLLDYLAVSFIESGWDVKGLMKRIVMSKTYQQASGATPDQFKRDPNNRLLARGPRFRLDSEVIRDQILATSGLLNDELYGKSVKPPQPAGLWTAVSMPSSYPREYQSDTGEKIYRRSVYTFWKRGMPPPQMTILDAPTREACIARRERTNTPLQALLLMNEPEFLKAARHLAHNALADRSLEPSQRLEIIYETITSQLPGPAESENNLTMMRGPEAMYPDNRPVADPRSAALQQPEGVSKPELAAWTILVNAIYNLDITKTRG